MALDSEMGQKIRTLREALGYEYRPAFAELFGMTTSRLQSIELGRQRLNSEDFRVIYAKWPWAIDYLLGEGSLEISEATGLQVVKGNKRDSSSKRKEAAGILEKQPDSIQTSKDELKAIIKEALLEVNSNSA